MLETNAVRALIHILAWAIWPLLLSNGPYTVEHLAFMRRGLITLFLLAVLAAIAWWLWHWSGGEQQRGADPWRIVPVNAAVIIEVPSPLATWERFKSTSQAWNGWSAYPACRAVDSLMVTLREKLEGVEGSSASAASSTLVVALTTAEDGYNVTLAWSFVDPRVLDRFDAMLPGLISGHKVIPATSALPAMELTLTDGLLLLSTSTEELNDAIERIDAAPEADSLLLTARATLGEGGDAHMLVHLGRTQRLLNTWLMPEALRGVDDLDGWAAFDLRARPEATLLSGMLFTPQPPRLLTAAQEQSAGTGGIGRVLPPQLTSLWQVNISDAEKFTAAMADGSTDLFDAYGAWAYGAMGIATAGSTADSSERTWAVFTTEDPPRAVEALRGRCKGGCDTLTYREVRLMHTPDTAALAAVWGASFERFERPWWCLLGDRVVFSEQVGALREAIDAWTDGSSFQQDARTGGFLKRYASDASYTWWCDGLAGMGALRPHMKPRGEEAFVAHRDGWRSVGACMVQLLQDAPGRYQLTASMAGTNVVVASPGSPVSSDVKWSVTVGAPIIAGPFLLTDHLSRTQQVLVQDKKNRVHLISCTGKILWQRELDGPLIGGAHQVDRYKNGKLQMLFNTAGRIYLIDRNGENVTGFPITLPQQASAPLNVFDYDGSKEYRVLVPTVDAQLLNFDMNGKPVDGWTPPRTPAMCALPVEHLRIRGKDHLVLTDKNGGITVLDRRGAPRYSPKLVVKDAARYLGLAPGIEIAETRLVWEDVERNRLRGRLDGPIDTLSLAGDSALAKGLLRFPWECTTLEVLPHVVEADIDLDGVQERVVAGADGRVSAQGIKP